MDSAHGADSTVIRELAGFVEHRRDQRHAASQ
jgi:hypothetical protein